MPTLAGLLGAVDSIVSPAKRKLADLLANPVDSWRQMQGGLLDDTRRLDSIYKTAGDGRRLDAQGSVMGGLPQYKQAQQQQLSGLLNVMPVGATVWHGSPHKFDKFDASKIGTGDGAQAYGHGLYLAEHPSTAEIYQKQVTQQQMPFNPEWQALAKREEKLVNRLDSKYGISDLQTLRGMLENGENTGVPQKFVNAVDRLKSIQQDTAEKLSKGNLYKVDLPDEHIAKMLDWDKPLDRQNDAIYNAFRKAYQDRLVTANPNSPTGTLMLELQKSLGANGATEYLRQAGVPGIKYLDQGSRVQGQGTSNFVVFPGNEGILSILERNGIPLK